MKKVTIIVDDNDIPELMGRLYAGENIVDTIHVEGFGDTKPKRKSPKANHLSAAASAPAVNVSANERGALNLLKDRLPTPDTIFTAGDLRPLFREIGLNPSSASPAMARLAKAGLIKHVGVAPIGKSYQYQFV